MNCIASSAQKLQWVPDFYHAPCAQARSLLLAGVHPSVPLSICSSHLCIVSTGLKISSNFFLGLVARHSTGWAKINQTVFQSW